jgi:hypothetical protein
MIPLKELLMVVNSHCEKLIFCVFQDGTVDLDEFEAMAERVVEVNSIFTGSENGADLLESMTNKQLDVLIHHQWPNPANVEKCSDPLESVIKNIKSEDGHKKYESDNDKPTEQERFDHNTGMENSRHSRMRKVAAIGAKLRSEGQFRFPAPFHDIFLINYKV